ncbi:MAG: FecR domain-containing protein [Chloroflexota bacterium]|nr:FecR domain-containing protein [Chloroflexota bacterium]
MKGSHAVYRWIGLLLVSVLIVPLVACGGGDESSPTPTPTATPTATATPDASALTAALSSVAGEVLVKYSGSEEWVDAGSVTEIGVGDSLKTGADGYAAVLFFDGSEMDVDPNTEFTIQEMSDYGGAVVIRINHLIGTLHHDVEAGEGLLTYEIVTEAGSAIAQGTLFDTVVDFIPKTCVPCFDGIVKFIAEGVSVFIEEDEMSCAFLGGIPCTPFSTDPMNYQFPGGGGGYYGYGYPTPTP